MQGSLRRARVWFQLALTGGFIALLFWRVPEREVLPTLLEADWIWVLPALALFTMSKAVHALRWKVFLGKHRDVPYTGLLGIFLVHNMANAVLLLRAGDILRIQTTSQRYNIPRSELTATVIVVETLLDGLTFVILIAIAFSFGQIPDVLRGAFWGMAGLALIGLALGVFVARMVSPERLERLYPIRWLSVEARQSAKSLLGQFLDGMRALRDSNVAVPAIVLSLIGWLLEACAYGFFGQAFGLDLHAADYLLVMMTANFAVSIPLTPSGIGPYEVATQQLLVAMGTPSALAAGYAIGTHLCLIIWITITGLIAMWLTRLSPGEIFYLAQHPEAEPRPQPEPT
ncbi:MAG: lysylphosphatidylglycerol synthase transmembrane domain-containing protein [Dehalococcoidia bacterium]